MEKTQRKPRAKKEEEKLLTKDQAYNEIYLKIREEVDEFRIQHKLDKLNIKGRTALMIPYLDSIGLDTLEKISVEANLIAQKKSNLSATARQMVESICIRIAYRYQVLVERKNMENENPKEVKSKKTPKQKVEKK
jgi:hypothetical protein